MTRTPQRSESKGLRAQWRKAWATRESGARLLSSPLRRELQRQYGDLGDLRRVGSRPPLREYLTELWDRRHFVWAGARGQALTRYANEHLGPVWFVLRPMLDAAFYGLLFGLVLRVGDTTTNYLAFVLIGVFMFQLSARAISNGTNLVRSSKAMIRAFAFPRAALAISVTVRELLVSVPATAVMLLAIIAIPPHEPPTITWSFFPIILALQCVLNLGLALFFGWFGALLPDLAQAMSFVTRLLMYGSAVLFPIDRFIEHPTVLMILESNPIFIVLDSYRIVLMDGAVPPIEQWLALLAWSFGTFLIGFTLFWLDEERYGRE